ADEHDARVGPRHLLRELDRLPEGPGVSENRWPIPDPLHRAQPGRAVIARIAYLPDLVHCTIHEELELYGSEGLRDVIPGSGSQRLQVGLEIRPAAHHDGDGAAVLGDDRTQDVEPRHARQAQVEQEDMK